MADEFQLTAIIAQAVRDSVAAGGDREHSAMPSEHATCVAKAVIAALAEAGLIICAAPMHTERT